MGEGQTKEIRLIRTGDRKTRRRRKINCRSLYNKAMRREFLWALLASGLGLLIAIESVILFVLQAGPLCREMTPITDQHVQRTPAT